MSFYRSQVLSLYKQFLTHYAPYHPKGYTFFRNRVYQIFKWQSGINNVRDIERALMCGEYAKRELGRSFLNN